MTLILGVVGLILLVGGAELLVRGASRLAGALGVSPLIIGLTIVAFGTSAPELAISLQASFTGENELVVGNIVGSNIFNVLLILGLSALITPLIVAQRLVRVDVPIMIFFSVLMFLLSLNGSLERPEGLLLSGALIAYLGFTFVQARKNGSAAEAEYAEALGEAPAKSLRAMALNVASFIAGLALLVVGSSWLVDGARELALQLGLSELVIGLTIVAGGTSLPELATSLIAAVRGERDIAVGNVVGSNIFNILSVLGISALVASAPITVPSAAINFDIPVMIAVAFACIPVFFSGIIARWQGALFFGYALAYVGYVLLAATDHDALEGLSSVMLLFAFPLTTAALGASVYRELRRRRLYRSRAR